MTRPSNAILKLLCYFFFLTSVFLDSQRAYALEEIDGAGFITEEGEFLSDQVWTNDDWIDVATELITSGGTVSFELYSLGTQYALSCFFESYVKPIEFWLQFIGHWRGETGLRAPEDFRMMTGMMLDNRADITWLQTKSADLSEREGWDHVFPIPWQAEDDYVGMNEIEGGMALVGVGAAIPDIELPAENAVSRIAQSKCKQSKLFERYINHLGSAGYLENSLGIPKGSKYLDLSYHGGVNGVDGFFVTPDGKCHLLEMKWTSQGASLGKIKTSSGAKIYQAGPQWFCKALLKVKEETPERFDKILKTVQGTRLSSMMELVEMVQKHRDELVDIYHLKPDDVANFTNWDRIIEFVRAKKGANADEFLEKIGKFVADDISVHVISKTGYAVRHMRKMCDEWVKLAVKLGKSGGSVLARIATGKVR